MGNAAMRFQAGATGVCPLLRMVTAAGSSDQKPGQPMGWKAGRSVSSSTLVSWWRNVGVRARHTSVPACVSTLALSAPTARLS